MMKKKETRDVWKYLTIVFLLGGSALFGNSPDLKESLEKKATELAKKLASTPLEASTAADWFELGLAYHDLTNQFGVRRAEDAVKAFETSYTLRKDPVTLAYLGSAWTLVGRDAIHPAKKIDGVMKGIEILDRAVQEDPQNVIIRRIRYENSFALPDIFERKSVAEGDVDYLIVLYSKNPLVFQNAYDPAHVFWFKSRICLFRNDVAGARKYASLARAIVKEPELQREIEHFLQGGRRK
ncbi:MAG TPA: hypothetical protein PLW34_07730 [Termitinemataceae bacterium]|nr:hypothetical protein [Termitinemataceae bacterium]HOM23298.1 hypothetical protein [Termitinemataceae bacterium]HPQ00502.1 hypothetical protein [Termitinemataceae bacterium]